MNKISRKNIFDKKKLLRKQDRLTRPPRLEGAVKEAMMQPKKKKKRAILPQITPKKKHEYTDKQRKEYQLRSKKH